MLIEKSKHSILWKGRWGALMMILLTIEPQNDTGEKLWVELMRPHSWFWSCVLDHIKCSVIVKIDWKKRMHRPQAPWSSPLWWDVVMCGWRASAHSYWWAGDRGEGVSSPRCTWQIHTRLFISPTEKKWDRVTTREYFTRHNSKETKPQINPGRQVRSGCDPTQNKLLLNRTKMHMWKHGDPSKAAYPDGFFHFSHIQDINI